MKVNKNFSVRIYGSNIEEGYGNILHMKDSTHILRKYVKVYGKERFMDGSERRDVLSNVLTMALTTKYA